MSRRVKGEGREGATTRSERQIPPHQHTRICEMKYGKSIESQGTAPSYFEEQHHNAECFKAILSSIPVPYFRFLPKGLKGKVVNLQKYYSLELHSESMNISVTAILKVGNKRYAWRSVFRLHKSPKLPSSMEWRRVDVYETNYTFPRRFLQIDYFFFQPSISSKKFFSFMQAFHVQFVESTG